MSVCPCHERRPSGQSGSSCVSLLPVSLPHTHHNKAKGQDLLKLLEGRHPAALQQVRASSAISIHGEDHQMASTESCRSCGLQVFTLPYNSTSSSLGSLAWPASNPWAQGPTQEGCSEGSSLPRRLSFPGGAPTAPLLYSLSMQQVGFSSNYPWLALPLPHDLLSMAGLVEW